MQKIDIQMEATSFSIGSVPTSMKDAPRTGSIKLSSKVAGGQSRSLEVSKWLPAAAEVYNISKDIRDYVIVPVPSIISDIPNTNGDSASLKELLKFNSKSGRLVYESWIGKPTCLEHDNKDPLKARGVILDSYLSPLRGFQGNLAKVVKLMAYDRTKDPVLVDNILKRKINTYSMGFMFKAYECSICGHISTGQTFCGHTRPKQRTYRMNDGRLAYRRCMWLDPIEISLVSDPAYCVAVSDIIMDPRDLL